MCILMFQIFANIFYIQNVCDSWLHVFSKTKYQEKCDDNVCIFECCCQRVCEILIMFWQNNQKDKFSISSLVFHILAVETFVTEFTNVHFLTISQSWCQCCDWNVDWNRWFRTTFDFDFFVWIESNDFKAKKS